MKKTQKREGGRYDGACRGPLHVVLIWQCVRILFRIRHAGGSHASCGRIDHAEEREEEGSLAKLHLQRGPTSPRPVLGT